MKLRIFASIVLCLCLLCIPVFAGFRVGDAWTPIPFSGGMFALAGPAGTWAINSAPSIFEYKNIGDTLFVNIQTMPALTSNAASFLAVYLPPALYPADSWQNGMCVILLGQFVPTPAIYDLYNNGYLVIRPFPGMFPNEQFPQQDYPDGIGLRISLTYRIAQ